MKDWFGVFFNVFFFFENSRVRLFSPLPSVALTCVVKSQRETIFDNHLSLSRSVSLPPSVLLHRFFGGWAVRGGVTGRPEFIPPYWYLAFFSDGFRICDKDGRHC